MWMALTFEMGFPKQTRIYSRRQQQWPKCGEPTIEVFCSGSEQNARRRSYCAIDCKLKRPFAKGAGDTGWISRVSDRRRHHVSPVFAVSFIHSLILSYGTLYTVWRGDLFMCWH